MAINNPLIPGDPYSYDLKWLVAKVKEILAQLGTLDEAIEAKIFEGFLEHSIVQFKTVAEMLAENITDGSIVLTLGYHEAGDQGGLFYLVKDFNPSQCALDYFLTLDNNKQIAIPVIVTPYTTPQMFGAYGDGEHDDVDALQLALNMSQHVIVKTGNYNLSKMVSIPEHVKLSGLGEAAFYRTENGFSLFSMGNYSAIDGVIIYGKGERNPYGNDLDREIETTGTTGVIIQNNAIYYADYVGIWAESAKDIVIENNTVVHYAHAAILCRDACRNIKVTRNTVKYGDDITTANRYAIMLSTGETEKTIGCVCTGNYVEDETAFWEGIDAHCIEDAVISDNVVINCATGIAVINRDAYPSVTSENVVISGNVIEQKTDQSYKSASTYGISYQSAGTTPAVISNNTLKNTGLSSVTNVDKGGIKTAGNAIVTGNNIQISGGRCLRLNSTKANGCVAENLIIQGNLLDANGNVGLQAFVEALTNMVGTVQNNVFKNCNVAIDGFQNYQQTDYMPGLFAKDNEFIEVTTIIQNNVRGTYCDYQSAYPAAGNGRKGAFVKNSGFSGSGVIGWICTADPVPGVSAATWAAVTV